LKECSSGVVNCSLPDTIERNTIELVKPELFTRNLVWKVPLLKKMWGKKFSNKPQLKERIDANISA
jgi:hypothetical protein